MLLRSGTQSWDRQTPSTQSLKAAIPYIVTASVWRISTLCTAMCVYIRAHTVICICICMYIYIYTPRSIYPPTYLSIYLSNYPSNSPCIYLYTYTCMNLSIYLYIYMYVYKYSTVWYTIIYIYIHVYIYMYMYGHPPPWQTISTCIYTLSHWHTYIYVCVCLLFVCLPACFIVLIMRLRKCIHTDIHAYLLACILPFRTLSLKPFLNNFTTQHLPENPQPSTDNALNPETLNP